MSDMISPGQWFAIIGALVAGIMFVTELRKWRLPGNIIGPKHRALRVGTFVLVEALLVFVYLALAASHKDPVGSFVYWTLCLLIGVAVLVLAMLDLREVGIEFAVMNRRILVDSLRDAVDDDRQQDTQ